jgi:hypothetical protein
MHDVRIKHQDLAGRQGDRLAQHMGAQHDQDEADVWFLDQGLGVARALLPALLRLETRDLRGQITGEQRLGHLMHRALGATMGLSGRICG